MTKLESIKEIKLKKPITKSEILSLLNSKNIKVNEDYLTEKYLSNSFENHIFLTYLPELVESPNNEIDLFYSQYYWLTEFVERYKKMFGEDEGLDQQLFKLCEEAELTDLAVDWNFIEEIENEVKENISYDH